MVLLSFSNCIPSGVHSWQPSGHNGKIEYYIFRRFEIGYVIQKRIMESRFFKLTCCGTSFNFFKPCVVRVFSLLNIDAVSLDL